MGLGTEIGNEVPITRARFQNNLAPLNIKYSCKINLLVETVISYQLSVISYQLSVIRFKF
ncbi:hypothetical protein VL20_4204 [Microcystis panniformis FACHB-1757]|uniref:Uncharacterized protein n=1 Tax=Microcystis panniformis FACHB-1757 TaxID=1638788 RepID=A0A0K1S575_9CHRO|nr:hypothetical protein VL20_4204 [Microcystis panniformis FACHB-1757]